MAEEVPVHSPRTSRISKMERRGSGRHKSRDLGTAANILRSSLTLKDCFSYSKLLPDEVSLDF